MNEQQINDFISKLDRQHPPKKEDVEKMLSLVTPNIYQLRHDAIDDICYEVGIEHNFTYDIDENNRILWYMKNTYHS